MEDTLNVVTNLNDQTEADYDLGDDFEDESDEDGKLRISLTPSRASAGKSNKLKRKRKSKEFQEEKDEEQIDKVLEEKLQGCARKNNLSSAEMKKLLRSVVKNDHVLALVKIQEEVETAREKDPQQDGKHSADSTIDCPDQSNITPKFTRSTARALNKKPIPILSLNEIEPGPEIAALISEDLHSDEEDEEYQPKEDEYGSDDDPNATISDFDSQPCTPMTTQGEPEDDLNQSQYTEDGLFKVPPRQRNDSTTSHHDEIIAKRTRSKVCLQETPIEAIESNFIPPDIPIDMYDFDAEIDNAWKEFLTNFSKPLNAHTEEDDDADPEYVAADHEPIDSEELKDVNISKKELSDLVTELFDGLIQEGVILEDIQLGSPKRSHEKSPLKKKSKTESKSELNSPVHSDPTNRYSNQSSQAMMTRSQTLHELTLQTSMANKGASEHLNTPNQLNVSTASANMSQSNVTQFGQMIFNPEMVSTPNNTSQKTRSQLPTNVSTTLHAETQQLIITETVDGGTGTQMANMVGVTQAATAPFQLLFASTMTPCENSGVGLNQSNVLTLIPVTLAYSSPSKNVITVVPISSIPNLSSSLSIVTTANSSSILTPTTTASVINSVTEMKSCSQSSVIVTKSTTASAVIDTTEAPGDLSTIDLTSIPDNVSVLNPPLDVNRRPIAANTRTAGIKGRSALQEKYRRKFEALREIRITNEPTFAPDQIGFTPLQTKLLEQQLRMHVQFIAQSFLQVYSHPIYWKFGEKLKNMLTELDKNSKIDDDSIFNIWNLKMAVKLIREWEQELSATTSENAAMMEFIHNEIEKGNKRIVQRFSPRIMKRVIQSPVFIYGHLLPHIPFWPAEVQQSFDMIPAVDQLLTHTFCHTYKELENYERRVRPHKPRKVSIAKVCRYIAYKGMFNKTDASLQEYVSRKQKESHYNPIKFFFEHRKAPPYEHVLFDIDLNNLSPLENRLSELPRVWQEFGNRLKALEIEKIIHPQRYLRALNSIRDYNEPQYNTSDSHRSTQSTASNITIHVNCVYDSQQNNTSISTYNTYSPQSTPNSQSNEPLVIAKSEPTRIRKEPPAPHVFTQIHEPLSALDPTKYSNSLTYGSNSYLDNDWQTSSDCITPAPLQANTNDSATPAIQPTQPSVVGIVRESSESPAVAKGQKLVTDYFKVKKPPPEIQPKKIIKWRIQYRKLKLIKAHRQRRRFKQLLRRQVLRKRQLKRKIKNLLITYQKLLAKYRRQYENPILNRAFIYVKSLEFYSDCLIDLRMFVRKMSSADGCVSKKSTLPKSSGDDEMPRPRKPYRVGESLRQMLLPEGKEDTNEKDAIFAMNFFDKVEETFCTAGQPERYELFQKTLKKFDCQKDRVADLYHQMENIFLPDHPHLAEIFLTFLLPSEAIEIGKFFEHFMITNMGSFINKLNIFFNKQPAQIKKIYSALGELADGQDVTMELVKSKILPLLKGNKFLIDWFLQTFESEKPNQGISNVYETINLKQLESQQCEADTYEVLQQKDFVEESADSNACQLKYINGGIYYGSRILLPAKLSFLANELIKCEDEDDVVPETDDTPSGSTKSCVHRVREYAEKQLKIHLDKSDNKSARIVQDEDKDKDKYILCDDNTFKAHAARLNPALYQVPLHHHINTGMRSKYSEGEISPKKQCLQKRRSPKKSLPRSPTATTKKSTSLSLASTIPESSKAIGIAKRLKSITSGSDTEPSSNPKSKRKQSKYTKNTSNDLNLELSGSQIGSDGALSDSDKSFISTEPKRKQSKQQSSNSSGSAVELQSSVAPLSISIGSQSETLSSSPSPASVIDDKSSNVWTRDEDKIILEEVKSGYDCEASLVSRILLKLPDRSEREIADRHQFLMGILTKLQGKSC